MWKQSKILLFGLITVVWLWQGLSCRKESNVIADDDEPNRDYVFSYPNSYPPLKITADNPTTVKGVALGRTLFYDPILSTNNTVSCASCHKIDYAFADNNRFSKGVNDSLGNSNAPSLVNVGWYSRFFWDGRAKTLEEQVLAPIQNPKEMHQSLDKTAQKLQSHPSYPTLFKKVFGTDQITITMVAKAIAQFERTIISGGNSRYDTYLQTSNPGSFTKDEYEGYRLFFTETGDCFHCHGNSLTTTTKFENNGLDENIENAGIGKVTHNPDSDGMFKVPGLRNIGFSAPYMHDGRFNTLEEVIEHYNTGLKDSRTLHPKLKIIVEEGGLNLSKKQQKQLLAFLRCLNDSSFALQKELQSPF